MVTQVFTTSYERQFADLAEDWEEQYQAQEILFDAQSSQVRRMLELQASLIAKALQNHQAPLRFTLPDRVTCGAGNDGQTLGVHSGIREQTIGGLLDSLKISDLNRRLAELEAASDQAVSTSARLMRHVIAMHLVHGMLPDGRGMALGNWDGGKISAYARRFFLPHWVAFDDHDNLLVNSVQEAEADIASMQRYLSILTSATSIAPYIVADKEYHRKRNGALGQLVNQGCALARHRAGEMINTIKKRVASGSLNRGLSLSLPYFDDEALEVRFREFQVIPAGRVQFVPAFVVVAARMEQIKVEHDPGLTPPTRKNILEELRSLEMAFDPVDGISRR